MDLSDSKCESLPWDLQALMFVSRRLPPIPRITGIVNRLMKPWYLRRPRADVIVDVLGSKMLLSPAECVEGGLLFYPQLYDRNEIAFLRHVLQPNDTFLDVGANVGFYSLIASRLVGDHGRVLAIEADPENFRKLSVNRQLNGAANITALHRGVSDRNETLQLGLNNSGNRGGHSFLSSGGPSVDVVCEPLLSLLNAATMPPIRVAKLDIEGFEFRVLRAFFADAAPDLYPQFLIVERNPGILERAGGDVIQLLKDNGYDPRQRCGDNWIMEHRRCPRHLG